MSSAAADQQHFVFSVILCPGLAVLLTVSSLGRAISDRPSYDSNDRQRQ
jgi:hypothetical protein